MRVWSLPWSRRFFVVKSAVHDLVTDKENRSQAITFANDFALIFELRTPALKIPNVQPRFVFCCIPR